LDVVDRDEERRTPRERTKRVQERDTDYARLRRLLREASSRRSATRNARRCGYGRQSSVSSSAMPSSSAGTT
jgi:hypothetical protein